MTTPATAAAARVSSNEAIENTIGQGIQFTAPAFDDEDTIELGERRKGDMTTTNNFLASFASLGD